MVQASVIVFLWATAAVLLGWLYFRRYTIQRPPIGVFNLGDVALLLIAIVLVPVLCLVLPVWLVTGLLGLGALSILNFMIAPVLSRRWLTWVAIIILLVASPATMLWSESTSPEHLVANNLLQVLIVVGVSNLWARSGMKARDAAWLVAGLIAYDWVFTTALPFMGDLLSHLDSMPFAPLVAWPVGSAGQRLAIGTGDLLLATVFPPLMRKAYGRRAGLLALLVTLAALSGALALPALGHLHATFPVMIVLGPLMLLQYGFWHRHVGPERKMWQYLQAEPKLTADRRS